MKHYVTRSRLPYLVSGKTLIGGVEWKEECSRVDRARCWAGRRSAIKRMYRSCNRNERGQLRGGTVAEAADDSRNRHGNGMEGNCTAVIGEQDYSTVLIT